MTTSAEVSLPTRLWTLYSFTIVGAVLGEFEIERVGLWDGMDSFRVVIAVGAFATPQLLILSRIKMNMGTLLTAGIYCLLSIFGCSALYARTDSAIPALAYLYLYFPGILISLVCYLLWAKYSKNVQDNLGKVISDFYTKNSLLRLSIPSLFFSLIWFFNIIFLVGLVGIRWNISPKKLDRFCLISFAIVFLVVPNAVLILFTERIW